MQSFTNAVCNIITSVDWSNETQFPELLTSVFDTKQVNRLLKPFMCGYLTAM